jgi:hypothetical protein
MRTEAGEIRDGAAGRTVPAAALSLCAPAGGGALLQGAGGARARAVRRTFIGALAGETVPGTAGTAGSGVLAGHGGLQRRAQMGFHGLEVGPERVSGLGQDGLLDRGATVTVQKSREH